MSSPVLVAILGFLLLPRVFGFNWNYPDAPRQCSNFTVVVTGRGIVFPLKILIVPVGPSPLTNEVRNVMEVTFPTNATTVNFQLPYPASSKFAGLVADASGYSGNATAWTVLPSEDTSCFDTTKNAVPPFTFSLSPTDIAECRDVRISWTSSNIQGTPSFLSVIPNGQFGPIPPGKIETEPLLGTGFIWRPPVRARTNLIIVGGDNRGMGTGGFVSTVVNPGDPTRDATGDCPAPTPTQTGTTPNIGAIVGGVIGGVAVLGLLIFTIYCLIRKKRKPKVVNPIQQYAPASPKPTYYNDNPFGLPAPAPMPPPPQEPGWGFAAQETRGQLPMQVTYADNLNTGTTAVSSTGGWQGSPWKSPVQTTPQWSTSYDSPPPWDGRA